MLEGPPFVPTTTTYWRIFHLVHRRKICVGKSVFSFESNFGQGETGKRRPIRLNLRSFRPSTFTIDRYLRVKVTEGP